MLRNKNKKIQHLLSFSIPLFSAYGISLLIDYIRVGVYDAGAPLNYASVVGGQGNVPMFLHMFGLFFSPGLGLLIFAPILITIFFSFPHFFKNHKSECVLFLSTIGFFLIFYGSSATWHGLNAWGARYMIPIIPFLILPLGASIEKRTNFFFKLSVVLLGIGGAIINLIYVLQDVSWFVWGFFGSDERGLYSLARKPDGNVFDLWINPIIIWTFEFSQIIQSSLYLFSKPQLDIFLLKILGVELFLSIFIISMVILSFLLVKSTKILESKK